MKHLLNEYGVTYTRDHELAKEQEFKKFTYAWEHKSGESGVNYIYTKNFDHALKLVNVWGSLHPDWKYYI